MDYSKKANAHTYNAISVATTSYFCKILWISSAKNAIDFCDKVAKKSQNICIAGFDLNKIWLSKPNPIHFIWVNIVIRKYKSTLWIISQYFWFYELCVTKYSTDNE